MDGDLRPATCSRPGMAKHSATPQTLPPRKNLSLTERVPAVGLSPRPMGGVNAPGKTLKLCLEWPTVQVQKGGRVANGVRFRKTLWVSALRSQGTPGVGCGARLKLIKVLAFPFCVFHYMGQDTGTLELFKTRSNEDITSTRDSPDQLARGPALRTKPVFVVNALG